MLESIRKEDILFLDIETVPRWKTHADMPEHFSALWSDKMVYATEKEGKTAEELFDRAGIYAEFGKIICITVGIVVMREGKTILRLKSFASDNEKELLEDFGKLLMHKFSRPEHYLCAHNGKEFDFPYIARRMLVNGIKLPQPLDLAGRKPWEVKHLDTLELWKFGDYKHYTSLNLLAALFDIPTPKDDIKGSDVAHVYWQEQNLKRIVTYCEKDVVTIVQLYMRYTRCALIEDDQIERAT